MVTRNLGGRAMMGASEGLHIEPQARTQTDVSGVPRIFQERGLYMPGRSAGEMKVLRNVWIEHRNRVQTISGDIKTEIFTNRRRPSFKSSLQFMLAIIAIFSG